MKINKEIEDCLNEQFPKGKCKERGNALVLNAITHIELEKQKNSFKDFIKQDTELINQFACGNITLLELKQEREKLTGEKLK